MSCHYGYVLLFFITLYFAKLSLSHTSNYEGYKVLTITPRNERQLEFLTSLDDPEYDFWKEPSGIDLPADLIVPPWLVSELEEDLQKLSMDYFVRVPNLQEVIDESSREKRHRRSPIGGNWSNFFNAFREMQDVYGFMDHIATSFPGMVKVRTIGKSFEGKPLKVLIIGKKNKVKKPIIWVDGGIHGREWISPSSVLYIANELVTGYGKSDEATRLVNHFEWHILPVVNPDGYQFSLTKEQMWRKNRRPVTDNGKTGIGVDLNRNFPYKWSRSKGRGAKNVSAATYPGKRSSSESEVQGVVDYLSKHQRKLSAFVTLHSCIKSWLYPWSHKMEESSSYKELRRIGGKVVEEIKRVTGETYVSRKASLAVKNVIFGTSMDWAHGSLRVTHSYTFELRDFNSTRFFVPPSQILPIGKEAWIGVKCMGMLLRKIY